MVRRPLKKRASPLVKKTRGIARIDASRLAVAAVERIKTLLRRTGHLDRMGPPALPKELEERAKLLGEPLPPSYLATMQVTSSIGAPERMLSAAQMRDAQVALAAEGGDDGRLLPFCAATGILVCFDRNIRDGQKELGIIEHTGGVARFAAGSFGEWLDQLADEREESIARAAAIPASLGELLAELGFTFEDPVIGRLESADVDAIEELLGEERTAEVRGTVNRLFDSSGRASLTLNLDEFTLAVAVRTGIYLFEAAEVFRWLRRFRDQDFFRDERVRDEAESVRDLRVAPREPPLVQRGVVEVHGMPSPTLVFRAASGTSIDDFFVLGRTPSMREASIILHVQDGVVTDVQHVPEPLSDIYVTTDGIAWGLSHAGTAIRFAGGTGRAFPLERPTPGRTAWYGIGDGGDRVLVWGSGTVLEFDGVHFLPFAPDARLDPSEAVIALVAGKRDVTMLVVGDGVGAVARFDGRRWLPIDEEQLIEIPLLDLDVWHGMTLVLTRDGRVLSFDEAGKPTTIEWNRKADAFNTSVGPRALHGIRGYDGGSLLSTNGGVVAVGPTDPIFYSAPGQTHAARIVRVGGYATRDSEALPPGLVMMVGPHLWTFRAGALNVVDTRSV